MIRLTYDQCAQTNFFSHHSVDLVSHRVVQSVASWSKEEDGIEHDHFVSNYISDLSDC
jgi:hypothetical protein